MSIQAISSMVWYACGWDAQTKDADAIDTLMGGYEGNPSTERIAWISVELPPIPEQEELTGAVLA